MAHLTSTFSSPHAGTLEVTLEGVFEQGTRRDAGFPGTTGGAANILVRGFVGPSGASRRYTQALDRNCPSVTMSCDYPGGSAVWPFGTEEIDHLHPTGGGLWTYGMRDLRMKIVLLKR